MKKLNELWARLVFFMDGKKTYTGAALVSGPKVIAAVAGILVANGVDSAEVAKYTAWGLGTGLVLVGVVHKIVKWLDDQTPSCPPPMVTPYTSAPESGSALDQYGKGN